MTGETSAREKRRTSAVTAIFAASCFVAIALFQSLTVLGVGGSLTQRMLPMMGEAFIGALAVAVIAISAYRMKQRVNRIVWALLAVGVLGATLGDALWITDLLITGRDSTSGAGFAWYALEFIAIPAACGIYVASFRGQVDLTWPLVEATAAAAIGLSAAWFLLMGPVLRADPLVLKVTPKALYVLADFPLLAMPTILVLLTIVRARERSRLTPWLIFGAGILFIVSADIGWFIERTAGTWRPGSLVDFAFMGGHVLIATASLSFAVHES